MIPILRVADMRELDRLAIEELGVPSLTLMENAGRAVAEAVLAHFGAADLKRVLVVCGRGNNGGDGFVVARHLREAGVHARVLLIGAEEGLSNDARVNAEALRRSGGGIDVLADEGAVQRFFQSPPAVDAAVDALLGTGAGGAPRGAVLEAVRGLNRMGVPVASIDLPSGIDADTGAVPGAAVEADLTVTLAFPKRGLWLFPARRFAGIVETADIGIPGEALQAFELRDFVVEAGDVAGWLPAWPRDAHKGTRGRLLVLGGSEGLTGAPTLAARAALRAGAGLVTAGVPRSLNDAFEVKLTEAMTLPLAEAEGRCLAPGAIETLREYDTTRLSACVLGPGLSRRGPALELARLWVSTFDRPMVVDADALFAFAGQADRLGRGPAAGSLVLTPHPGEAAALFGTTAAEVQANRIDRAREWAVRLKQVVVLKGAPTVVGSPVGEAFVNPTGGPLLATGGTGDVLAGLIGGFLAQGAAPLHAALLGVWLHGFLADLFEERRGPRGLVAGDLIDLLPLAFGELIDGGGPR
jgi:hydroxyethylthiazole kinase-like uncharacterized protein yjeF